MSAEIIQFVPRPSRRSRLLDFPTAIRSATRGDDLTMDHADTAPCEYVFSCEARRDEGEPA